MLELNPNLPIVYERAGRAIKPELMAAFFRYGFDIRFERKYKILFLVLINGIRLSEAINLNIADFVPQTRFCQFNVKIQKKRKCNYIATRVLPESVASHLRAWIKDNYGWIKSHQGFVFPPPNNKGLHISKNNVESFMAKKRKQLNGLFPKLGFMDIDGYAHFKKPRLNKFTGRIETQQPLYRFCVHSFRHFFARHISNDPEIASQILRHDDIKTTLRYRKEADLLEIETKLTNELFDSKFLDAVTSPAENVVAVWDYLKQYEK